MSDINMVCAVLRAQAWERAKGELRSMLATHYYSGRDRFTKLYEAVDEFVERVENNGLHE